MIQPVKKDPKCHGFYFHQSKSLYFFLFLFWIRILNVLFIFIINRINRYDVDDEMLKRYSRRPFQQIQWIKTWIWHIEQFDEKLQPSILIISIRFNLFKWISTLHFNNLLFFFNNCNLFKIISPFLIIFNAKYFIHRKFNIFNFFK